MKKSLLLQKVLAALKYDLMELSAMRINGHEVSGYAVKKEPRHLPDPWDMSFHIQLRSLTVASLDITDKLVNGKQAVEVVLQRWKPNYETDVCKAMGKPKVILVRRSEIAETDVRGQLEAITLQLSQHLRRLTSLPANEEPFKQVWTIHIAANSPRQASAALNSLAEDLSLFPSSTLLMGSRRRFALTARPGEA